ncbi:MAG: zf-HC2 domain-containing protein [Planctomycetes bacterium]|nr:zf-HC2 domain-containing protein [Planctomycetota bacterium]
MEMSCEKIEKMLVDYADEQLSPGDSKKVAEHLEKCEHCQKILEALQRSLELSGVIWEDGLKETKEIRATIQQKARNIHWPGYAAAAAGIILLLTTSILWRALVRPVEKEINFADIERRITEAGNAARLLAATELLAEYPNAQTIVKQQYRYIVETYPETTSAKKAKLKIQ